MRLKLNILAEGQQQLWQALGDTPAHFILYGGTALALRLGHRESVDFDFFTSNNFNPENLYHEIAYLQNAEILQLQTNTLTCSVMRQNIPIKVSFFGEIGIVENPIQASCQIEEPDIRIASFPDLVATKMLVIQQRAEKKDYLDIAEILKHIRLSDAIGYARKLYGNLFNPFLSLKALTYYDDGDLMELPPGIKAFLINTVQAEDITRYE
jgi:predicted nucleotidyltransferase component of viral defense system